MSPVTTCPCCNSTVSVEDDGTLGIVRVAKPEAGHEWQPQRPRRGRPVTRLRSDQEEARAVIKRVARDFGLTLADLRAHDRSPRMVRIRWEAARAAGEETDASLPQIGRILYRDHTTVLHGLRQLGAVAS
jgi:hypothetical protein